MAAISDADVSIDASGNIRWTGAATTNRHTVLEFIQWLMDKQDDDQAVGDDLLDITVDTPFSRSTDQILSLNWPFNIDDTFASHLYDGSVEQALSANEPLGERWSGLEVLGPVETGTEYMIIQSGRVLPAFWGTGINAPGGGSLIFSRHLVKSVNGGAQIDGGRITVLARTLGDQYRRFPVTLGTANSVAAIGNGADIFNTSSDATLAAITDITNTEGFQELDIDGSGAAGQEYYSQWTKGANSINDTYEYTKFITQNAHITDQTGGTPTGTNYVIENATILGQAQSFKPNTTTEQLTEARFNIKIGGGTPTGTLYAELWDSDDLASQLAKPTGAALARSADIPASAITSTYEEVIFRFDRKDPTGAISAQATQRDLINAEYFIVLRHDAGDATHFFHVQGAATDQDATMNRAEDTGTWAASATSDLNMTVKSSPEIHGIAGEVFEGISVEVGYDGETGTEIAENEIVNWGTELVIDTVSGTFIEGEHVRILADGGTTVKNGGEILYTNGTTAMLLALENISSNLLDNDDIVGVDSGATAKINVTITNQDKSGGTGLVLARDDNSPTGELYMQVITGVNPVDNSRIYKPGGVANYVDATATINVRSLNPEFLGTSTGSNIIGAYGIGFLTTDVGASDLFQDLSTTNRTPPNNQTFTVTGLVSGEDRVLVGPRTGTTLNRSQLATDVNLTVNGETTIQCSAAIPAGTPAKGTLRVELDSGIYKRVSYTAKSGANNYTILADDTFVDGDVDTTDGASGNSVNLVGHLFETGDKVQLSNSGGALPGGLSTATDYWIIKLDADNFQFASSIYNASQGIDVDITSAAGGGTHTIEADANRFSADNATQPANVFISYIDKLAGATSESYSAVHTTNVDLFVRVRDGGTEGDGIPIKTFEATAAQFLATAQTVAAVRTADS